VRAFVICLILVMAQTPSWSQTSTDTTSEALKLGKNAYDYGDYQKTLNVLVPLVVPEQRIAQVDDRVEAYCIIGLSHFFLKDMDQARIFFEQAIRLRPDKELDSVVTPPDAISLFEKLKKRLAPEIAKLKAELQQRRQLEAERRRRENIRYVPLQINSRLVAALPFGAGQFQNNSPFLGATFLGTEVAAISVSLASYLAVESLRGADGRFRNADVGQARSYQQLQLVSGGIALAIMATGIIEAMISYRPTIEAGKPGPRPSLGASSVPAATGVSFSF